MSDPWSSAFSKAIETEKEGAKDFEDILVSKSKRTYEGDQPVDGEAEGGEDKDDEGGYSQPRKLARFVQKLAKKQNSSADGTNAGAAVNEVGDKEELEEKVEELEEKAEERNMAEVCSRQICRSWLKFTFLQLGTACPDTCMRKHEITCRPEQLYKDYSFKGLSAKQRKDILQQLKAPQ